MECVRMLVATSSSGAADQFTFFETRLGLDKDRFINSIAYAVPPRLFRERNVGC